MNRRSVFFLGVTSLALSAGFLRGGGPEQADPRGNEPLSPAEALERFVLSPELDLQIDLVAHEPNVVDPVAIAFDEQGRMFVAEMSDYPLGPPKGQPPLSQIRLLEDTDGNGTFETAHLFADDLLFANGVLPWKGGVIVTLSGEVRYMKDTDGDHKADVNEVWFKGFAEKNSQLRANDPTLGPDGWIYIANGLRGGKVTTVRPDWPKQTIDLQRGDFRFNPHTGQAELVTGVCEFGQTFDAWGNRFISTNRNPCDQVMFEYWELERNPDVAIGKPISVVAAAGNDSRVYPEVDAWVTSILHAGQFTAACGVNIFNGNALPQACVGNVFTCEPTGSLLHREVLTPAGGTFKGTPGVKGAEFLASTDSWFRPVNSTVGPDGAMYVVDMYRAVIEHPQFMPVELKDRPDQRWGDELGRIYRVAAKGNAPAKLPTLAEANTEELIAALKSSNGWMRETASRLLLQNPERLELSSLKTLAESAELPQSRLRAVQLAGSAVGEEERGRGGEGETQLAEILLIGLQDEDPRVVAGSVVATSRLLYRDKIGDVASIEKRILELASSDDATVRFEIARCLGSLKHSPAVTDALAMIAAKDAGDHWTRAAVLISMGDHPLELYDAVVKQDAGNIVPFLAQLAEVIGRRKNTEETAGLLERLSTTGPEAGWATPILLGLGRGMGGSLESALKKVDSRTRGRFDKLFAWAASVAADEQASVEQRNSLIALIALAERSFALPVLLELMEEVEKPTVRVSVVQALGQFRNDERIAPALLEDFDLQPPTVRSAALDAILADPGRALELLEAVKDEEVSVAELGPTRMRALSKHRDKEVQAMAKTLFAPPADRQAVLKKYAEAATMNGNSQAGRELFKKNCATCHQIGDLGMQVGPDIADSRTRTPQALLTDILDPNRAIDGQYLAYSVVLTDGTVQTGLLTSQTGGSVTLTQPEGKTLTLSRDEIQLMHSDGTSLMPVGIERTISPEQMADLISFIKNWRYLDGAVPLGEAAP